MCKYKCWHSILIKDNNHMVGQTHANNEQVDDELVGFHVPIE